MTPHVFSLPVFPLIHAILSVTGHYHFVIAPTEDEARSQLPDAPCIFSARFSTDSRNSLSYWCLPVNASAQEGL
ncbi:host cell division inhibitor Icd-like protein [Escherichia coli]|uniref:host cell division inhibitor Icd-like protein n=1 Tax=Escherichia coli TaxID=562 RepID=UPI003D7721E6